MAMNKTEKAEFEAFKRERDMARSLRWPEYSKPERMTAAEIKMEMAATGENVARGWFENSYSQLVSRGCSNGVSHNPNGDKTSSQNAGVMYRYKSEALRVMRLKMTEQFAKDLAKVDAQIAAADLEEL